MATRLPDVQVFEALSNPYRYQLLVALKDATERGADGFDPTSLLPDGDRHEARTTRVELVHLHLPKLVGMGYIIWDRKNGCVRRGPSWDELAPVLRMVTENRDELPDGLHPVAVFD